MSAKKKGAGGGDERWLDQLEATVREAGGALETLRREKADLVKRVKVLEARVGELEADGGSGAEGDGGEAGASAWREERQEIRTRVEKLTERLEGLLEEE